MKRGRRTGMNEEGWRGQQAAAYIYMAHTSYNLQLPLPHAEAAARARERDRERERGDAKPSMVQDCGFDNGSDNRRRPGPLL